MDLEKIKKVLHSLDTDEYREFMKEVHSDYPLKTPELTDHIVNHWKKDHSIKKSEEFFEIIREREAEHIQQTQEKRQEDLERIQNMKSRTGIDPVELFPEEIWKLLLDQLPPGDKRNFRQVHETFRRLTEDTLISDILLPMILDFKVERFWGEPEVEYAWLGTKPQESSFSPLAECTKLRLISKSLRNAVDRWFEDDLISKLHNGSQKACPTGAVLINLLNHRHFQKFARMKEHLSDPATSKFRRFFTRSLYIVYPVNMDLRDPELADFVENINDILDHVGDQIWYFSFELDQRACPYLCTRNEPNVGESFASFFRWLSKMPNLRWLKLTIMTRIEKDYRCPFFRFPEGSSPPPLSHLERLDLKLNSGWQEPHRYNLPAFNQILAAYPHVKILNLLGLKYVLERNNGFVSPSATTSTSLVLEAFVMEEPTYTANRPTDDDEDEEYDSDDDNDDFDAVTLFQSIVDSEWPLLRIDCEMDMGNVCVYSIFRVLEKIQTLQKLCLSMGDITVRSEEAFLRLPQLTHFEFKFRKTNSIASESNWIFFFSLQFLLYAKRLHTLIWNCEMKQGAWVKVCNDSKDMLHRSVEMIDFDLDVLYLLDMMECKDKRDVSEFRIWHVFRSLDTVAIELAVRKKCVKGGYIWTKSVSKKYRRCEVKTVKSYK